MHSDGRRLSNLDQISGVSRGQRSLRYRYRGEDATFVFQKIAHPRPAGQHQLGHILDDLGLLLGGESGEPLGEALERRKSKSDWASDRGDSTSRRGLGWVTRGTHHFALAGEQNQIT